MWSTKLAALEQRFKILSDVSPLLTSSQHLQMLLYFEKQWNYDFFFVKFWISVFLFQEVCSWKSKSNHWLCHCNTKSVSLWSIHGCEMGQACHKLVWLCLLSSHLQRLWPEYFWWVILPTNLFWSHRAISCQTHEWAKFALCIRGIHHRSGGLLSWPHSETLFVIFHTIQGF